LAREEERTKRGLREEIKRQIVGLKFFAKPFTIVGFLHCRGEIYQTNKIEISFFSSFPQVDHGQLRLKHHKHSGFTLAFKRKLLHSQKYHQSTVRR